MKKATYIGGDGKEFTIEYDENAPCLVCQQPVGNASAGGTVICPACDCGQCRYCRVRLVALNEKIDGGRSLRELRAHVAQCKATRDELYERRKRDQAIRT